MLFARGSILSAGDGVSHHQPGDELRRALPAPNYRASQQCCHLQHNYTKTVKFKFLSYVIENMLLAAILYRCGVLLFLYYKKIW